MNGLVGEKLSIITSKAQTTRHRIMGILNGEDFQIVYSDTPGILKPEYELHKSMMKFVSSSLEDADVVLFVTDIYEDYNEEDEHLIRLSKVKVPILLILNKIDQTDQDKLIQRVAYWQEKVNAAEIIPVSALKEFNLERVLQKIIELLPLHPPFYDKEELTDRPERFFAAEIIREKIFLNYKKEIPYSSEVGIIAFQDEGKILRISAEIYVERDTQKGIIIGNKGDAIKKVGTEARTDMEKFFGKKVFLETFVKVEPNWRSKESKLRQFGYLQ